MPPTQCPGDRRCYGSSPGAALCRGGGHGAGPVGDAHIPRRSGAARQGAAHHGGDGAAAVGGPRPVGSARLLRPPPPAPHALPPRRLPQPMALPPPAAPLGPLPARRLCDAHEGV